MPIKFFSGYSLPCAKRRNKEKRKEGKAEAEKRDM